MNFILLLLCTISKTFFAKFSRFRWLFPYISSKIDKGTGKEEKMRNKIIILLFCLSAALCYYATRPAQHPARVPATTKGTTTQTQTAPQKTSGVLTGLVDKMDKAGNNKTEILPALLPPQQDWPKPLSAVYGAYNIKTATQAKIGSANWVPLKQLPQAMPTALIAVEDRRFYEHGGVDLDGILRALLVNIQADEVVQGASTLTQQLVKNNLLNDQRSVERKIWEAALSLLVEGRCSKDDILEMYLNTTYYGAGATGIKAAAHTYFGKEPQQLSLTECATLAGLPNAPSALNPYENPEGCKQRRNLVLSLMGKQGFLRQDEVTKAQSQPLTLK